MTNIYFHLKYKKYNVPPLPTTPHLSRFESSFKLFTLFFLASFTIIINKHFSLTPQTAAAAVREIDAELTLILQKDQKIK